MSNDVNLRELAVDRDSSVASASRRHLLTRWVIPIVLIIAFLLLLGWALRDVLNPPRGVSVIPVQVARAENQTAGTPLFNAAGWVEPRPTTTHVAALAEGVVKELLVVEDQQISAGDVIALLVDDDANLEFQKATAEWEQARALQKAAEKRFNTPAHLEAPLAKAQFTLASIDRELVELPYDIIRAKARQDLAAKDLKAKKSAKGVVSQLAIDTAQREQIEATAALQGLEKRQEKLLLEQNALLAQSKALKTTLDLKIDESRALEESQARTKLARVAVDEAQLRVDRMEIRAPKAGRVLRLLASPGTHVQGGMGPGGAHTGGAIISMYQPKKLQIRVDVRFENLPLVVDGQTVSIDSPAVSKTMSGKVLFPSSLADIQKNTLEVKVEIENPPSSIKPEMLVDVTFLAKAAEKKSDNSTKRQSIFVPSRLVHQSDQESFVWVADQSAMVARRTKIETGNRSGQDMLEVTTGLDIATKLIDQPHEYLRDGMRIRVVREAE